MSHFSEILVYPTSTENYPAIKAVQVLLFESLFDTTELNYVWEKREHSYTEKLIFF